MKKKIVVMGFALFNLSAVLFAQQNVYRDHFVHYLMGTSTTFSSGEKMASKDIAHHREQVWSAWKEANDRYAEDKLIPLQPLSATSKGAWALPENLEPQAVMPFYFGYKGEKPKDGYPLFLYLHGSGPKAAEWETGLKLAQLFDDGPSAYFIPQIPNEGAYYRWYQKSKQYAWNRLLRQAMLHEAINPNRLYVFGISEGGYGSQRLASFYSDYWAAAGPMAGGEPLKNAPVENCRHIGFSFLTGALDKGFYRDILTTYTKEAFDSLAHLFPQDYQHRIELVPGRAHAIDYRPTTPWLKQWVRNPWPKHFSWEDFEMDGWNRKGFYNLVVEQRCGQKGRTRYDVDIENNVVRIQVRDVHYTTVEKDPRWGIEMKFARDYQEAQKGIFTLYLDEHLVNLDKKVKIFVNGHRVFYGKMKCNTVHLVNSILAFGDPMRVYPAAFTVDLEKIK